MPILMGAGTWVIVAVKTGQTVNVGPNKVAAPVYTLARMTSIQSFKYVRVEASIRLPAAGRGIWPAFWALGEHTGSAHWPNVGEINVIEQCNPTPGDGHNQPATILLPSAAYAQGTTAMLSGTASDATGTIIPGAEATLTGTATGTRRTTKANSAGIFVFAAVPSGDYNVRVEMPGFESTLLHNIHLDSADNKNLTKVILTIGEVTQRSPSPLPMRG